MICGKCEQQVPPGEFPAHWAAHEAGLTPSHDAFDAYQFKASRTACSSTGYDANKLALFGLGITGEAGEVADLLKKYIGHGHPLDRDKLIKELGDVLWYLAAICSHQRIQLSDVARANIAKLEARYPQGFSHEASINRKESAG